MPFVEGETLRDRLSRETQLPVAEAVRIATEVAARPRLRPPSWRVHRDIKPENILLHGGRRRWRTSASPWPRAKAGGSRMTETGMSLGTPAYMSPEQAIGDREVTPAPTSTLSAACCTRCWWASRRSPAPRPQAIAARALTADAPSLIAQRRSIPPAVDQAVHRALERVRPIGTTPRGTSPRRSPGNLRRLRAGRRGGGARCWLAGVAALGALAVFAVRAFERRPRRRPAVASDDDRRVVAVLPFRNISRDSAQQYFSAGMTEEITSQLARVAALRVMGRAATAQYDTAGNRLERMARELGVGSVVDGSVRLAGDRVRIAVGLTDVHTGQTLWSEQYDRQLADLFAVQDDVAHKVTAALQATLTPAEAKRVAHVPTSNMAAYQLYLRALTSSPAASENAPARTLLRQAIQLDSSFAARLGASRPHLDVSQRGGRAGLHRLRVHRRAQGDRARPGAGRRLVRPGRPGEQPSQAVRRAAGVPQGAGAGPSHDGAMADLANVYVALGRFDEALDWALRAPSSTPTKSTPPTTSGCPCCPSTTTRPPPDTCWARSGGCRASSGSRGCWPGWTCGAAPAPRHSSVRGGWWRTIRMTPRGRRSWRRSRWCWPRPTRSALIEPLARRDPEAPAQMFPESLRSLYAMTLHRRGDDAARRRAVARVGRRGAAEPEAGAEGPRAPMELAAIAAIEGRTGEAMDWLERGYRAGWKDARVLELDPFFASVRGEPRYRAVLARMRRTWPRCGSGRRRRTPRCSARGAAGSRE